MAELAVILGKSPLANVDPKSVLERYLAELPGVSAHGRTIGQARESLRQLVALVFEEERRAVAEMLAGKEVQREAFFLSACHGEIEPGMAEQTADRRVPATS